ncbi:MAG: hypothetical protein OYH76_19920 [Defluviicoccus sp.]|nr:hypothetical protein [Defluviicoccus sp.]MDE0278170.1 hypothetical protein [Defluviicoccus sp.]
MNFSSHGPEFFRSLLSGRIWLFERQGKVGALHFAADGSVQGCWTRRKDKKFFATGENWWWEVGIGIGGTKLALVRPVKGRVSSYGMVLIYDGRSGRLHGERFNRKKKRWAVIADGWVEQSWPRALLSVCEGLKLPSSVEVGAVMTSLSWSSARKNGRAVVRHPGWRNAFPGAVGLGDTNGKPTLTLDELRQAVAKMQGMIVEDVNGERRVVVLRELDGELWKLGDDGEVAGVGTLELVRDGTVIVARWAPSGSVTSYYVGYPFPLRSTGQRYRAFRMMDELASRGATFSVELHGGGVQTVRLLEGGKLIGGGVQGGWWLTEGTVALWVGGREYRYPWRKFADETGWNDGQG